MEENVRSAWAGAREMLQESNNRWQTGKKNAC